MSICSGYTSVRGQVLVNTRRDEPRPTSGVPRKALPEILPVPKPGSEASVMAQPVNPRVYSST